MNHLFLWLVLSQIISIAWVYSASVGVTIGGASDSVLFETTEGVALDGGYLFVGAYDGVLDSEVSYNQILSHFVVFSSDKAVSGPFGNFPTTSFTGSVVPSGGAFDFRNQQIYVLVTNSDSIATASELAFFTADSLFNWVFPLVDNPGLEPGSDTTDIILSQQNLLFVGRNDTLELAQPGAQGVFDSIQLEETVGPEPLVIPDVQFVIAGGRPGIEFEFPTSQAGTVTFVLQESQDDTLLESDWVDVAASPMVVSDDGTTQVIQIIHPALLSTDSERFFRLQVRSPL